LGIKKGHFKTPETSVRNYLSNSGIDQDFINKKVVLVKGLFEDTLRTYNGKQVALLHLDVDLYQSYKECIEFFYPRVAKGGIIAFDEYQSTEWPGAKKAIDEYSAGKGENHQG